MAKKITSLTLERKLNFQMEKEEEEEEETKIIHRLEYSSIITSIIEANLLKTTVLSGSPDVMSMSTIMHF